MTSGGESQERPFVPYPALCEEAAIMVPDSNHWKLSSANRFVESTSASQMISVLCIILRKTFENGWRERETGDIF